MNIKKLLFYIIGTIIVGSIFSFFSINNEAYEALIKPALNPPAILFPIVWSILFILMGISLYIATNKEKDNKEIFKIYIAQLIVNTLWTLIFFGLDLRLFGFIWIMLLIALVIIMIVKLYNRNKVAGYLQIPYLLWLLFAAYLNFAIYFLNK